MTLSSEIIFQVIFQLSLKLNIDVIAHLMREKINVKMSLGHHAYIKVNEIKL